MTPAKPISVLFCAALIALCANTAHAQATGLVTTTKISASPYGSTVTSEKPEFPQWARDLRRGEILAFGAFPFMIFFATTAMDLYRASNNNWDSRYLPWPAKAAGAVEMNDREHLLTIGFAAAGSVALALADHLIIRIRRIKAERQLRAIPEGELIILRKPWPPEDTTETEAAVDEPGAEDPPEAAPGTP
jgi:hypothetical protein